MQLDGFLETQQGVAAMDLKYDTNIHPANDSPRATSHADSEPSSPIRRTLSDNH